MQKIRNLRFTLKIHYTVFRYNGIAQLIKCGICNYFIWIHIFELIIFQKKIDTYLYNFNLFNIYACIYIKWYMYVYVLLVVILFIKYIFVYPNIITFFLFWIIQLWTTDRCIWNTLHYYFEISNLHFTAPSPTRKRNKTFIKSTIPFLHGNQTRKLKTEIMTYKQLEKKINP